MAFTYAPDYLDRLIADAGHKAHRDFDMPRIPPLRLLTPEVASTAGGVLDAGDVSWQELGVRLATRAVSLAAGDFPAYRAPINAEARVTRVVRSIDRHPAASLTLDALAGAAGLSPYHFLRTFQRLTGVTPHQYIVRARLRDAAIRLSTRGGRILDIALDSGFGDVSNFNRAFRAEFGLSPGQYQRRAMKRSNGSTSSPP